MSQGWRPPAIAFVGRSGAGKTTLLCSVLRILRAKGIRVAAIKHAHKGFEIDYPGKDSRRLREAGANPVLLVGPTRLARIEELAPPREPEIAEAIALLGPTPVDLLLIEGFRAEGVPKIELFVPSLGQLFCRNDPDLLAVASEGDGAVLPEGVLSFDRNDAEGIAALILRACGLFPRSDGGCRGSASTPKGAIPLKEARRKLREAMAADRPNAAEEVSLSQSAGRVLARDLVSPFDLPSAPTAAMDGYAVRASELGEEGRAFSVAGTAAAGAPFAGVPPEGSCVRIFTGAVLPEGTDLVIPQEEVVLHGDRVILPAGWRAGENVRARGESFLRGQELLRAGTRIGPGALALLAAAGQDTVPVYPKLRVGLLCTGRELRPVGAPLRHGEIYDSNRAFLSSALAELGVVLVDEGIVDDDSRVLEERLDALAEKADLLVTTGGVSAGESDYVGKLLAERNAVVIRQIAVKPGRPFLFARWRGKPLFGLPGTPAAVFVLYYDLIRPRVRSAMGEREPVERARLPALSRIPKKAGRTEYWAGRLALGTKGEAAFAPVSTVDAAGFLPAAAADLLALLPEESECVEVGEPVEVIFLPK